MPKSPPDMSVPPGAARPFVAVRDDMRAAAPGMALRGAVLAMGNFEGVHRGHRAVIDVARARAQDLNAPAAALTFEPHPRAYFNPAEPVFRLTEEPAKLRLLRAAGLDGAFVMAFNQALATLPAADFISTILVERYQVAGVVVGFDFHFGKARSGSPEVLAQAGHTHGFAVDIVPAFSYRGERVSSGLVRQALSDGDVARAADLLGFAWFVTGDVIHGEARGRDLGYPTANLALHAGCGLRHGIYAVKVGLGGRSLDGVASFGRRPTFDNGAPLLEVFVFDFSGDLYGQTLDVGFVSWIRPELKFDGVDALIRQMDEDSRQARAALTGVDATFPPALAR